MDTVTLALLIAGLVLLVGGAELLVRGASRLAVTFGISPLVVGLTVVAFGTSAPEMAVSVRGALVGQADLVVGNVVGSNIFNTLAILGLAALLRALVVQQKLVRLDVPLMIGVSALVWILALDGAVGRGDGAVLFLLIVGYTVWSVRQSRAETKAVRAEYEAEFAVPRPGSWPANVALVLAGLVLLVIGSRWLVDGAVALAETIGLSTLVVGLTVVAAGTSLPELATSVVATVRGERDIAVGNVVGSNLFNLTAVLGLSALLAPGGVPAAPAAVRIDLPVMIAAAVACLPIFFTGYAIRRWEGAAFVAFYTAYVLWLLLDAAGHDLAEPFSTVMLALVIPLTALTLAIVVAREWRASRR